MPSLHLILMFKVPFGIADWLAQPRLTRTEPFVVVDFGWPILVKGLSATECTRHRKFHWCVLEKKTQWYGTRNVQVIHNFWGLIDGSYVWRLHVIWTFNSLCAFSFFRALSLCDSPCVTVLHICTKFMCFFDNQAIWGEQFITPWSISRLLSPRDPCVSYQNTYTHTHTQKAFQ